MLALVLTLTSDLVSVRRQLKSVAPNHGWVTDMTAMGAAFDRAAEAMA